MKRLLVTSDDFGMCHAVNRGIVDAMTNGIVRSSNLMVPCPWFEEAAALSLQHRLPVGLHLTVTCEWDFLRWGPLTQARSLRDDQGHFPRSHELLATTADPSDIEREFEAQIERARARGIVFTHFDTHMLSSRSPGAHAALIQEIVARLARKWSVPYTYERHGDELRYFTDDFVLSDASDDELTAKLDGWRAPGTYHLITHAALASDELGALTSPGPGHDWAEKFRLRDHAFVTRPETRAALEARGFELIGVDALTPIQP